MNKKQSIITLATVAVLAAAVIAQTPAAELKAPVVNIGTRHGNLREAQSSIVDAFRSISRAQADNQYQLGGHAQKAKELLSQADAELRLAADVSNSEGR